MSLKMCNYFSLSVIEFGGKIPIVITDIVERLRSLNAKHVEGIFRVNGKDSYYDQISREYANKRPNIKNIGGNAYDFASLLKRYLRESSNKYPFFKENIIEEFDKFMNSDIELETKIEKTKATLNKIPKPCYYTLMYIARFMNEIAKEGKENKMNEQTLAICTALGFFPEATTSGIDKAVKNHVKLYNAIIEFVYRYNTEIFGPDDPPKEYFMTVDDLNALTVFPFKNNSELERYKRWREYRRKSVIPFLPTK